MFCLEILKFSLSRKKMTLEKGCHNVQKRFPVKVLCIVNVELYLHTLAFVSYIR